MQIHYQGKEDNHIWAYSDGANLDECLMYCQEKCVPYTSLRFETDDDAGCVIIMAPEIEGRENDHEFLIEYIRKHMTIFSEDLIAKIKLRCLHCVHYENIPPHIVEQIPDMLNAIFTEGDSLTTLEGEVILEEPKLIRNE